MFAQRAVCMESAHNTDENIIECAKTWLKMEFCVESCSSIPMEYIIINDLGTIFNQTNRTHMHNSQ